MLVCCSFVKQKTAYEMRISDWSSDVCSSDLASTEQQVWRTVLPRSGIRDFTIDADVLYDQRTFCVAISNNGIYPNKADLSALQDYMVAYIAQLQKELDGESQRSQLGWYDDYKRTAERRGGKECVRQFSIRWVAYT